MHPIARTQKILTFKSETGECRQQKHTQHAPSTKTECGYLCGWIIKRSHTQNLTKNSELQRYSWKRRRRKRMERQNFTRGWPTLCSVCFEYGRQRVKSRPSLLLLLRSHLYLWGSSFGVEFSRMSPSSWMVHAGCVGLGVFFCFFLPAFTRLGQELQDLLSPCEGLHVCTDSTSVYTPIRKSFQGVESEPMLTSKGKIPSTGGSEEGRTRNAESRSTVSSTHYRLSYSGPKRPSDTSDLQICTPEAAL